MPDLPSTRNSLIVQLRAQSGDAWAELLLIYEAAIYRYCRARGLQEADACDATQEVFAAVHKRIDSWDADPAKGSFRGWMLRVARNIAADKVMRRSHHGVRREPLGPTQLAEIPETAEAERTAFMREYRRSLVHWAMDQVRPEANATSWQAFHLTAIEGHDPAAVAQRLGVSVGAVYTAKCRIVAKIRARLATIKDEGDTL